ncbi:MAG: SurA N-terminal domain-containing protein [Neisseriaceae bacterium]|nr:SurA N-terminal domain-containing protein [Neisseriaceae bacterium]
MARFFFFRQPERLIQYTLLILYRKNRIMFDVVEKHRGLFKILLALIALSFVTFTAHSFSSAGGDYIVSIGGVPVSKQEIDKVIRNNDLQPTPQVMEQAYASLVNQAYVLNAANQLGVSASDERVKKIITEIPLFQDNGAFSKAKLDAYLSQSGQSEAAFVETFRKDLRTQSMAQLLNAPVPVADQQAKTVLNIIAAVRDVQTAEFRLEKYAVNEVADNDLTAFYQKNKNKYQLPNAVKFDFVRVDANDLADKQTVSDEEISAAVAKAKTDDNPEPNTDEIRQALQLEKASRALAVLKENMSETAFNENTDLTAVAKIAGVEVQHNSEWLSQADAKAAGLPEKVVEALFSDDVMKQRNNSDAIDDNNAVWVVRVVDVRPEQLPELATIKEQVTNDYKAEKSHELAIAAAKEALNKLEKGEEVADLAWDNPQKLQIAQAQMVLSPAALQKFIAAKPAENKPAFVLAEDLPQPLIIKINAIEAPQIDEQATMQAKLQLMQQKSIAHTADYLNYLKRTVKVKAGHQKLNAE